MKDVPCQTLILGPKVEDVPCQTPTLGPKLEDVPRQIAVVMFWVRPTLQKPQLQIYGWNEKDVFDRLDTLGYTYKKVIDADHLVDYIAIPK